MRFRHGETVLHHVFDSTAEDDRGNPIPAWLAPVPVVGVAFAPAQTVEPRPSDPTGGTSLTSRVVYPAMLYGHAGWVVGPKDRFTVRGRLYEVEGDESGWRSPFTGWAAGTTVELKAVEG